MLKKLVITTLFLFLIPLNKIKAEEYINSYSVYIKVNESGALEVSEKISVNAEGEEIKRGIYRDFPTKYKTPLVKHQFYKNCVSNLGESTPNKELPLLQAFSTRLVCQIELFKEVNYNKNTTFDVKSVTKNGTSEPHFVEDYANGKRLYVGDKNTYLNPGLYTYVINYKTNYQIGFFDDYDELYFNAIGTGWVFNIVDANILVDLPVDVNADTIKATGFAGSSGSNNENLQPLIKENKVFFSKRNLDPHQGVTIVVGFNKGVVSEPTNSEKWVHIVKQNLVTVVAVLVTFIGTIFVSVYYYYLWRKYGRDPKTKGAVRNYDTPKNISPAGVFYTVNMRFDNNALTATIISLAIKGYLLIQEQNKRFSKNVFTLKKTQKEPGKDLIRDERRLLYEIFKSGNTFTFKKSEYNKIKKLIEAFKIEIESHYQGKYVLTNSKLIAVPIAVSVITSIASIITGGFLVIAILLALNIVFAKAIKARTVEGKNVYDQAMGLKEYLLAVEKPRYTSKLHTEIPFSLGVYEKYLPYAVALGVEPQWSARLKKYLDTTKQSHQYAPAWYVGDISHFNSGLANGFSSSISNTIASSSTAPGSSSGFSGGSVGGGGGGGGGGGW